MACRGEMRTTGSARDDPYRIVRDVLGLSYWSRDRCEIGRLALGGHSDQTRLCVALV